jgi:hypothetical protein
MTDLGHVWLFTRHRLAATIADLSDEQMRWTAYEGGHSIFEYIYHVAGAAQ